MSKTKNPYLAGPQRAAWDKGYTAALSDAAGITDHKEPRRGFGRDIIR